MELTYTKVGDYYIPDLVLDEPEPVRTIGKYGSLRRSYLKQHRRSFYQELVTSGKLQDHLIDIEDTAHDWLDKMMPEMAKATGATEELKAHDPMAWVGCNGLGPRFRGSGGKDTGAPGPGPETPGNSKVCGDKEVISD